MPEVVPVEVEVLNGIERYFWSCDLSQCHRPIEFHDGWAVSQRL